MKKFCFIMTTLLIAATAAVAQKTIRVSTDNTDLIMQVNNNGRLYMVYLGDKLLNASDADRLDWTIDTGSDASVSKRGHEAYMCSGGEDFFEPALGLTHADGNKTTYLYYKDSQTKAVDGGNETVITLADNKYDVEVRLHYVAYTKQNVIKAWSEITNKEKGDISLWKYASAILYFSSQKYFLTNYHGDWAREAQPAVQQLTYGKKVIDTKLGTRAAMHTQPFFELGLDAPAAENSGRVMLGTIAWTGNFRCIFEVDNVGGLRVIPGINPYASDYKLKPGKTFVTPEFIFTLSNQGTGLASRNLHDWEPNHFKLPGGVKALTEAADEAGVKFGIWIEPEMVNPKSELFEKHPDWVIMQPGREPYYYRNQLVLDLANPKVQDYVFSVVDNILKENPGVAYFKWDCNSPITNIYSPYLRQNQGNLYVDYVRGLYNVLHRIAAKYPHVPMMLCSGGGARCDYEALKYFTEFWCSDNTDPFERIYIQWSMSKFFPVKAMASHVTEWNKNTSMKFRLDVASMCKLGFDIDMASLSQTDYKLCQQAVANYDRLKPVILDGDMFKLVSPYEGNHAAVNYVTKDKKSAVVFAYDLHPRYKEPVLNLKLQGLDPTLTYNVNEINLADGQEGLSGSFTGDYLMKIGLPLFSPVDGSSRVLELTAM